MVYGCKKRSGGNAQAAEVLPVNVYDDVKNESGFLSASCDNTSSRMFVVKRPLLTTSLHIYTHAHIHTLTSVDVFLLTLTASNDGNDAMHGRLHGNDCCSCWRSGAYCHASGRRGKTHHRLTTSAVEGGRLRLRTKEGDGALDRGRSLVRQTAPSDSSCRLSARARNQHARFLRLPTRHRSF